MLRLHLDAVDAQDPFAGKLRTGTAVMEFVAAPVRQRERSYRTPMTARSAGRSVSG
jgi:hypothetical protein